MVRWVLTFVGGHSCDFWVVHNCVGGVVTAAFTHDLVLSAGGLVGKWTGGDGVGCRWHQDFIFVMAACVMH